MHALDDAGVYKIRDDLALVQTVDFFTPIVDDPRDYGAIAAANSLSDIYAMGATPLTALNIVGFPDKELPVDTLVEILAGSQDVLDEAGVALLGGHSVRNPEPIFGLSVTGTVHPERILTKAGARAGDHLILTKPLGTGILSTALRSGKLADRWVSPLVRSMRRLNREGMDVALRLPVRAATDVTGFGLMGHLHEMARKSGLRAVVDAGGILFLPGTEEMAREKQFAAGLRNNQAHVAPWVDTQTDLDAWPYVGLFDPQTSGGLLIASDPSVSGELLEALQEAGVEAFRVGRMEEGRAGAIGLSS